MPLIEGEALRARLARERELPVRDALRILRDVADPLAYAHGRGLVHRDIKPDNVLLSGGHALVADFGIAKALSESSGSSGRGIADLVMWCLEKNPADRPQTAAELVPALEGMPTPTGGTTTVRNAWPAPGGARLPRAARGLVAPALPSDVVRTLVRGRLRERLGRREEAAADFNYVVDAWARADSVLQPYVTEARAGLNRLGAERKP